MATREIHERLHGVEPFEGIVQRTLDRSSYARLLSALHAFHATVEPVLAAWPATATLAAQADRLALLKRDLETLGAGAAQGSASPPIPPFDIPPGPAAAAACLYVVRGSTLGGKLIYRQLNYLFGDEAAGRRFFAGAARDSKLWQETCRLVEQQERSQLDAMKESAAATFSLFESCVSRYFAPSVDYARARLTPGAE